MIDMVFKFSGMGLVMGGSVLLGKKYAVYQNRRVIVLDTIYKTMCMIREKILRENELLEVCMASCGKMYPLQEGNLFEEFAKLMEAGKSPQTHWKEHVKQYLEINNLYTESLYVALADLENAFAQMHADSLVAAFDTACAFLEKAVEQETVKCEKEGPFIQKISVALGVLLCVLLY